VIGVVHAALGLAAAILALPCLVLLVQCLAALRPPRSGLDPSAPRPRIAVLVPAHDEESIIGATVASLLPELGPGDRLVVIADNCTDATADRARAGGALVLARNEPERRGKGFALVFGLEHLSLEPPDIVVIVDADCRVASGGIERLARLAARHQCPIQADYLLTAPGGVGPKTAVSAFAFLVRNRVRARGMTELGLPVQLTGSGMGFPWSVIRQAAHTGSHVVEDLVMGIDLALKGYCPRYTHEVEVKSELPTTDRAATTQRKRWETGQLSSLFRYAPKLVGAGIAQRRLDLVGMGLDLSVPPLALLVGLLVLVSGGAAFVAAMGDLRGALLLAAVDWAILFIALGSAWFRFGRETLPLRYIVVIPFYILWKLPLYASFLVRGRQKAWVRTDRNADGSVLRD
jgi:cellulose synthase/poly-beta-1,6-N-acetylglucosamine synthase-like glycosyltransferase